MIWLILLGGVVLFSLFLLLYFRIKKRHHWYLAPLMAVLVWPAVIFLALLGHLTQRIFKRDWVEKPKTPVGRFLCWLILDKVISPIHNLWEYGKPHIYY